MINNWEMYKEFVIGDLSYGLPIYNYNDYEQGTHPCGNFN
jgi:hypothetical protein